MLAKFVEAVIDPGRVEAAARAVDEELIPSFLSADGALHGYWMVDPADGRVLAITTWSDPYALRRAAATEGRRRAEVFDRIGAQLRAVSSRPVLAADRPLDLTADRSTPLVACVTWFEGLRPGELEATRKVVMGRSDEGLHARLLIGEESLGEVCAVSLWNHVVPPAPSVPGRSVGAARHYRIMGVASRSEPDVPAPLRRRIARSVAVA